MAPADLLRGGRLQGVKASVRYTGLATASCLSPYLKGHIAQTGIVNAAGKSASAVRDHLDTLAPILKVKPAPVVGKKHIATNSYSFTPSKRLGSWEFHPATPVDRLDGTCRAAST